MATTEPGKGISLGLTWPEIFFGPVNLLNSPPAWFFYLSQSEKKKLAEDAAHGEFA